MIDLIDLIDLQKNLGTAFAESPPFDLQAAYGDSACITPLIFILSAGADVNDYLLGLGAQKGKTPTNGGLKILSLGQGQGPIAERLMVSGRYVPVCTPGRAKQYGSVAATTP